MSKGAIALRKCVDRGARGWTGGGYPRERSTPRTETKGRRSSAGDADPLHQFSAAYRFADRPDTRVEGVAAGLGRGAVPEAAVTLSLPFSGTV